MPQPSTPHNADEKFAIYEPIIRYWLEDVCPRLVTRMEGLSYIPSYEHCITTLDEYGWSGRSLAQLLDKETNGQFTKDPNVQMQDDFDVILTRVMKKMLTADKAAGQQPDLATHVLLMQLADTPEEAGKRRLADIEPPNDPVSALAFAERVLEGRCGGRPPTSKLVH